MSTQILTSPARTFEPEHHHPSLLGSPIQTLRQRLGILKYVLEAFQEPSFLFDQRLERLAAVNSAAGKWLGYTRKELLDWAYREVFTPWDESGFRKILCDESGGKTPLNILVPAVSKSGKSRHCLWRVQKLGGGTRGGILVRLVRRRITLEENASSLVLSDNPAILPGRDPLTGLADRSLFARHLTRALLRARKNMSDGFAVLFLDLDRFKAINDAHGHRMGDRVLRCAARRIVGAVRPSDLAARYGGDEFTIFLDHVFTRDAALEASQRILDRLNRPMRIDGREFALSASIGIAVFQSEYETFDEMLDTADRAMYHAKSQGGGRVWFNG